MADRLTKAARSNLMRQVKSVDTKPEMVVRKLLHAAGYRYRLHGSKLLGKPDLVFRARRKVIFVHGCFWHGHGCKIGRLPKSRLDFWGPKLARNQERDLETTRALEAEGWGVLVVWQCDLKDPAQLTARLLNFLGTPGSSRST